MSDNGQPEPGSQFGPGGSGYSQPPSWNSQQPTELAPSAPSAGYATPGPSAAPLGPTPSGMPPYGTPGQQPGQSRTRLVLSLVGAAVALILILLILAVTGVFGGTTEEPEPSPTTPTGNLGYGTDQKLDELWDSCEGGDMGACDELYSKSPRGSDYADFGSTCGETKNPQFGGCDVPVAYGDDPTLDSLWDSCKDGDMDDCDTLYYSAGEDSEYTDFADTCGETQDEGHGGRCTDIGRNTFGDDAELDALWTACEEGEYTACDELYYSSPYDSEYENFGATCGYLTETRYGDCEYFDHLAYGDSEEKDAMWDSCEAGAMDECDLLFESSLETSEYREFADTCGGTRDADLSANCVRPGARSYGDDPFLDGLYDQCESGDHGACSRLNRASEWGTEYYVFGHTCGGTVDEDDYANGCF